MTGDRVQRDLITNSAAVCACEKGEQWQHALDLCTRQRMREEPQATVFSALRDTITYSAAIAACERGEPQQRAWEIGS